MISFIISALRSQYVQRVFKYFFVQTERDDELLSEGSQATLDILLLPAQAKERQVVGSKCYQNINVVPLKSMCNVYELNVM